MSTLLEQITSKTPHNKKRTRKGRGEGSKGKTSGRGGKGASARGGGPYWKRGHEGGQTQASRRFPKRGFSNFDFERRFHVVNVQDLERFDDGATVDAAALIAAGLVPDKKWPVKILGEGTLSKKLTVVAGWYSKSAFEQIGKAGGTAQNLKGDGFKFPKPKPRFEKNPQQKGGKKAAAAGGEEGAAEAAPAAGGGEAAPAAPAPAAE